MSARTFPLARSMRVTVAASWLATHSDPPPTARLWGLAPVVTGRPASRLVAGSIRATLSPPPPALGTQTAPGVAARSSGARPTGMVATVRPDSRSMRVTASLPSAPRSPGATPATHSAPWATAMAAASAGTRSGSPTTWLVAGSIRTTVPEAPSTQRTPSATARLLAPGRGMTAANRPRSKAGTVVPLGAGGGGIERGLPGVSAPPEHPAAASSTATASIRPRGAQEDGGRRVAGPAMAHLPGLQSEHPFYLTGAGPVPWNQAPPGPPQATGRATAAAWRLGRIPAWPVRRHGRPLQPSAWARLAVPLAHASLGERPSRIWLVAGRAGVTFDLPGATESHDGRRSA